MHISNVSGLKIEKVNTHLVGKPDRRKGGENWVFLELITENGITGYGECNVPFFRELTLVQLIKGVAEQYVIGTNPFDVEKLRDTLIKGSHYFRPPGLLSAQVASAYEMACWDIVGKYLDQPVYNLLGGEFNEKIWSYTYLFGWGAPEDPPEKAGEIAKRYLDQGFSAIKFDPVRPIIPSPRSIRREELKYARTAVKSVREAVGDKCEILIGTHGQLNPASAIRFIKAIEEFDPFWFEEPVPPEDIEQMAKVASHTSVPIATGERLTTLAQFKNLLESGAAQILQVNVGLLGIMGAKKVAGMAEPYYAEIAPWMHCGPIAGAASIQLDVCSPNFLIQEGLGRWGGFTAEILVDPIKWKDGYIVLPKGPGLGVALNEKVLEKSSYNKYSFPW